MPKTLPKKNSMKSQSKLDAFLKKPGDEEVKIVDGEIKNEPSEEINTKRKLARVEPKLEVPTKKTKSEVNEEESSSEEDEKAVKLKPVKTSKSKKSVSQTKNLLPLNWFADSKTKTFVGAHVSISGKSLFLKL